MARAALYLRVSTADQAERFSLAAQQRALTEHCRREGMTFEIFEDAGISGETITERPAMMRLLEAVRDGRFDVVLAVEMERFTRSRDGLDMAVIKRVFRDAGVRFGTPAQLYDAGDSEDSFVTGLLALLASREKSKILDRTRRGRLEAARQGRYVAGGRRPPFGYRRTAPGILAIHEPEAATVRLAFSLLLGGMTTRRIVRELADRGVPSPSGSQSWARSMVRRLLTARIYTGTALFNRTKHPRGTVPVSKPEAEWVRIPTPRIVADDTFEAAQQRLRENQALSPRHSRRTYLLRGLLVCGVCGRAMVGRPNRNRPLYACAGKSDPIREDRCPSPTIAAAILEAFVWEQVRRILRNPELVMADVRASLDRRVSDRDELSIRHAAVVDALQRIPEERERVISAYTAGWVREVEAKGQLDALDRKRAKLEHERRSLEARLSVHTATEAETERLEAILARIGRRLARLTAEERFAVVHAFLRRIVFHADGGIELVAFVQDPTPPRPTKGRRRDVQHGAPFLSVSWAQSITRSDRSGD